MKRTCLAMSLVSILFAATGCKKNAVVEETIAGPDYTRELRPGESALRLITDPSRMPDLGEAYRSKDIFLLDSIDQSLGWFAKESSKQHFPFESITHDQARASLVAFSQLLQSSSDEAAFAEEVQQRFDVYESVGYNGEGVVLFTGYYSPIFKASRTKSSRFAYPLYKRPADLVSDRFGKPLGRKLANGQTVPYYTRAEIDQSGLLAGSELVWLEDPLSVYIVQVNGSAKFHLDDGSMMYVGYAGKTDWPYVSLSEAMLEDGLLKPTERNLPAMRHAYRRDPQRVVELINRNKSYVFFTEYPDDRKWPAGSLGVKVLAETSLATDKKIYPRGGMVLVDTQSIELTAGKQRFYRFMLDQDTGGAIKAPGRADIFMGVGATAEILAGGQYAEGRLYYFFLKPEFVDEYLATAPMQARH